MQVGWARDAALTAAIATIRGVDVRASWVPLSSPGAYQLSYLVPTHDALLVGSPPTLLLQLADPRCVDRVTIRVCRGVLQLTTPPYLFLCTSYPNVTCTVVNVTAGSPLLTDLYDAFVIDTDPPVVTLTGVVNGSMERKSVYWIISLDADCVLRYALN